MDPAYVSDFLGCAMIALQDEPLQYEMLVDLLINSQSLGPFHVAYDAWNLLAGRPALIHKFNAFLPEPFRMPTPVIDAANVFIWRVKERFGQDEQLFAAFCDLARAYRTPWVKPLLQVTSEIYQLFGPDRRDLQLQFYFFWNAPLPKTNAPPP